MQFYFALKALLHVTQFYDEETYFTCANVNSKLCYVKTLYFMCATQNCLNLYLNRIVLHCDSIYVMYFIQDLGFVQNQMLITKASFKFLSVD